MVKVFLSFSTLYTKWKIITEKIGNFQFSVIFSVFYIVLVIPLGIISSIFNDFLLLHGRPKWVIKKPDSETIEELIKQS